ncbi:MAG TPA: cadherin repeat domain-containing protein [Verrucomicrobia bacterium]|nr:cadherin repeat domain-containing protein [Verrucomicrobiales bacterium]HIL54507.1 cadherin repeat domain-containing protein [Verrucomicrobiota bacterium]
MMKHLLILVLWAFSLLISYGQGPILNAQTFEVSELSEVGTEVGVLVATDPEGDSLTFSIVINADPDDDQVSAFSIDGDRLLVADSGDMDPQEGESLSIIVKVSDGALSANALITVNLTDPENIVTLSSSVLPQNAIPFTLVGMLSTTGSDSESHSYRLLAETDPVPSELIVFSDEWIYLDDGSDQGIAWREIEFDDGDWLSGDSPLGYGTFGSDTPATIVSFGDDSNNKIPTTYFRQFFEIDDPLLVDSLSIDLEVDDGAILYINGIELLRFRADGADSFDDHSSEIATETISSFVLTDGLAAVLREGTNVLAVEVHQWNDTSSDLWLNLGLEANLRRSGISDAEHFYLIGDQLYINKSIIETNRSDGDSFSISIQSTDDQGNEVIGEVIVNVGARSLNPPDEISLDGKNLIEQQASGTVVGELSASDPDGNSFTFSVLPDLDYPANDFFTAKGNSLVTTAPLDFDERSQLPILVTVTDSTGLSYSEEFSINVLRLEEPPTEIILDPNVLEPNAEAGDLIGTLKAIDPNADQEHIFELGTWPTVIGEAIVPFGSSWAFLDDGTDQGSAWIGIDFDDASWEVGPAQLGYGDNDEVTVVGFVDTDPVTGGVQKNATTYFRHLFEVDEPASGGYLFRVLYDDAVIIYVNGISIAASTSLPVDTQFDTFSTASSNDNTLSDYFSIPPGVIGAGDNVIAVEIHQVGNNSSDISFDFELVPLVSIPYLDYFIIEGNELKAAKDFSELGIVPPFTFQVPIVAIDPFTGSVENLIYIFLIFADSDNDGLYDSVETDTGVFVSEEDTGTDPDNPDTDEDGWKDGAEVKLNTSPFDDRSRPKFQVQGEINNLNQFNLLFPVVSGNSYSIEGSENLRDWQVLESGIEGDGEAIERTYPASEVFRFYRARRQ